MHLHLNSYIHELYKYGIVALTGIEISTHGNDGFSLLILLPLLLLSMMMGFLPLVEYMRYMGCCDFFITSHETKWFFFFITIHRVRKWVIVYRSAGNLNDYSIVCVWVRYFNRREERKNEIETKNIVERQTHTLTHSICTRTYKVSHRLFFSNCTKYAMLDSMNVSLRTHYSRANFPLLLALFGWPFFSTVMRFKNYWLLILFFCSTLALSLDNQSAISNCGDCAVHCIIALFFAQPHHHQQQKQQKYLKNSFNIVVFSCSHNNFSFADLKPKQVHSLNNLRDWVCDEWRQCFFVHSSLSLAVSLFIYLSRYCYKRDPLSECQRHD